MLEMFQGDYYGFTRYSGHYMGIWIQKDLPYSAQRAVIIHELYHANHRGDLGKRAFVRELQANFEAFKQHPIGFFLVAFLSLITPSRWVLYYRRMRGELP